MKDRYYFARCPAKQVDCFAFPRTGSHLLNYCCQGLFDSVWFPTPGFENPEAIARQAEIDATALYALDLREDGVPFSPVHFNHRANGQHGLPVKGEPPALILIRDPVATLYSYYKAATTRWGMNERMGDHAGWVAEKLGSFSTYYRQGLSLVSEHPRAALLLRFEELSSGAEGLQRLVDFVGVRPKLSPDFVARIVRFDFFTRPGHRTFYRAGDNDAWRRDAKWVSLMERLDVPDFSEFGYPAAGAHPQPGAPA